MADSPDSGTVFISYSHQDAVYLARLQQHLVPYARSGSIPLWDDTQIKPGDDWKHGIERALDAARVALLLVSVSFLASEFVAKEELPRLLAAAEARGTRILPVILTPCLFRRTTLSRFQAINDPTRPLSGLTPHEQDLVWEHVVETVLDVLDAAAISEPGPEPAPAETAPDSVQESLHPSPPTTPEPDSRGSIRDKFPGLLTELITSTPGLILYYSRKPFTTFIPQEWDVPVLAGTNRWVLIFTFDSRKSDRLQLNLIINPGLLETRQRLLDMAHAKQPLFEPVDRELNKYYNIIYRRVFLTPQAYKSSSEAEVQAEIRKHWKDFLEHDLPQIQAALRSEAWIWK